MTSSREAMASNLFMPNFEELASRYDQWYETPLGVFCDALEKEAILSLAEPEEKKLALDVGCGTGNFTLELAKRNLQVVGVDPSKEMLQIASRKLGVKRLAAQFIQADARRLPFQDNTFDLVLSVTVCEFISSPETAISEMARVLKPGGRLVIGALNKYSLWALIRRLKGWLGHPTWKKARFSGSKDLIRLLLGPGLKDFQLRGVIYFPPLNNQALLKFFKPLERIGEKFLPNLAAFLAVRARK